MTAKELLLYEIDSTGRQLAACLKDVAPDVQTAKTCETAMSPRDMVEHLAEAYHAFILHERGEKHSWGTFSLSGDSWEARNQELWALRQRATDAIATGDDETLKNGFGYIVAHDTYHIGQLASVRVQHDPSWDPYSIYEGE